MASDGITTDPRLRQQDPEFVRGTFGSIARRYDMTNHLLSGGMDFLWRWRAAALVASTRPGRVLDLATGSGDLAGAIQGEIPGALVVGVDFCAPMLEVSARKGRRHLIQADGLALPFRDGVFDAVTVAFGLRNMASWDRALAEMSRVLRVGGLVVVMDFSLPTFAPLRGIYRWYLHRILPRLADITTGNRGAYEYLGDSIESFPRGEAMVSLLESSGFRSVAVRPLCFGIAAIYSARKHAPRRG